MHALIKSEAYYLTHDPVIQQWENRASLRRRAESLRNRLQYTGRAYTRIFMLVMRGTSVTVTTGGRRFELSAARVMGDIEEFLVMQYDRVQFQKYLARYGHC